VRWRACEPCILPQIFEANNWVNLNAILIEAQIIDEELCKATHSIVITILLKLKAIIIAVTDPVFKVMIKPVKEIDWSDTALEILRLINTSMTKAALLAHRSQWEGRYARASCSTLLKG
jgi:hypothetical protein